MTDASKPVSTAPTTPINFTRLFERVALLVVWVLLIALFSVIMPKSFLNWGNFSIMFASYAPAALLALAIIVPLTAGDYDLSVGATLTLSASMIGVLNVWQHLPIGLVLVIVLLVGVVVGLVNALFIIYFRVPSLVVTLGTTSVMSGLVQWMTNSSTIGGIDNALIMAVSAPACSACPMPSTTLWPPPWSCGTSSTTPRSAGACCLSAVAARWRASTASPSTACDSGRW